MRFTTDTGSSSGSDTFGGWQTFWFHIKVVPRLPPPLLPWDVLGLRPGATLHEVKKAYWRLANLLHPDLGSPSERAVRTEQMVALNRAYETLERHLS